MEGTHHEKEILWRATQCCPNSYAWGQMSESLFYFFPDDVLST